MGFIREPCECRGVSTTDPHPRLSLFYLPSKSEYGCFEQFSHFQEKPPLVPPDARPPHWPSLDGPPPHSADTDHIVQ